MTTKTQNNLVEKAILVIGNDSAVIKNLINQLAERGANIALICWQMQLDSFLKIKESVQAAGRRFLLIEQAKTEAYNSKQLIDAITAEFGPLDAIIDLSSPSQKATDGHNGDNPWLKKPGWPIVTAVVDTLAHA